MLGRFLGRGESFGRELLRDEAVDRVTLDAGLDGQFERPVLAPDGAFGDPASQDVRLRRGEPSLVRLGRRHELVFVGGDDALDEFADVGFARDERFLGQRRLPDVEAQLALSVRFVLAVASEAVVRKDWQHVAAEADRLRRERGEQGSHDGEQQRGRLIHLGVILRRSWQF